MISHVSYPPPNSTTTAGRLIFTVVNVARRNGIDPESALRGSNAKFRRRFDAVAARVAAEGREISGTPLTELDQMWEAVKKEET